MTVGQRGIPKYLQLKEHLLERVRHGEWQIGQQLPSESDLCEAHGVSRTTVRMAVGELIRDGILVTEQGRGTFVAPPRMELSLAGFTLEHGDEATSEGPHVHDVLSYEHREIAQEVRTLFPVARPPRVGLAVVRCTLHNDQRLNIERAYFPKRVVSKDDRELFERDLYLNILLYEWGVFVRRTDLWFTAGLFDEWEAKRLGVVAAQPAIVTRRISYDDEDQPVFFCESKIRADTCRFFTRLER